MGHEELKEIGINAYGHRHKLIKGVERLLGGQQGEYIKAAGPKNQSVSRFSYKESFLYTSKVFQEGPEGGDDLCKALIGFFFLFRSFL